MNEQTNHAQGSLWKSAFGGKCPRCGVGHLYQGFLKISPKCEHCDLDLAFADSGDGPAVFVIMIVGFVATGGLLYTEFTYEPPVWLLAAIWGPVTIAMCLALLYWLKGALVAQQYYTGAKQGRTQAEADTDPDQ